MPDKTPKILPCPFCGGESEVQNFAYPKEMCRVRCKTCGCETDGHRFFSDVEWENKAENIAAWNRRTTPKPEPLTLEQLREMGGQPVWIVEHPDWGHWELSADAEDYLCDRDTDFYGMMHNDPAGKYGLHCLGWFAYAEKLTNEGGTK